MVPGYKVPLVCMTLSVFVFVTCEFMPEGLLMSMATDLGVSESSIGKVISIHAWVAAISALPSMLLLRHLDYRKVILLGTGIFALSLFAYGTATSYIWLIVANCGAAVAESIFWSTAVPVAVKLVPEDMRETSIGTIFIGTSLATLIGTPVGRIVGLAMGWRTTFVILCVVTVCVLLCMYAIFPKMESGSFSLKGLPCIFRNRRLVSIYVAAFLFFVGYYMMYSYIEPYLVTVAGMSEGTVTLALLLVGAAGIFGSMIYARIYGNLRLKYVVMMMVGEILCLLSAYCISSILFLMLPICFLLGFFSTSTDMSLQDETVRSAVDAETVGMAIYVMMFDVGVAVGSLIGGRFVDNGSMPDIGIFGALSVMIAMVILVSSMFRHNEKTGTCSVK